MSRKQFTAQVIDTRVPMASTYLPVDRRDLNPKMTNHCVALFFGMLVRLNLCSVDSVDQYKLNEFAERLYKLVMRRHSKLWNVDTNGKSGSSTSSPGSHTSSTP